MEGSSVRVRGPPPVGSHHEGITVVNLLNSDNSERDFLHARFLHGLPGLFLRGGGVGWGGEEGK